MNEIPRNANGWPTVEPNYFTTEQLLQEAQNWIGAANGEPGTVGRNEFDKYVNELVRRGFLDELDVKRWRRTGKAPRLIKLETGWAAEW